MGYPWADSCIHVPFGLLSLEEGRISTREGKVVLLEEVLDRACHLARRIVDGKGVGLPERQRANVAEAVGVGAVKFMVLSVTPETGRTFSWDRALNLQENSGPTFHDTYARAQSILGRAGGAADKWSASDLDEPVALTLVKTLQRYPQIVRDAETTLKPNVVVTYANELARCFGTFYQNCKVLGSSRERSRLAVVEATATVLANALHLLGVEALAEM